MLLSRTPVPPMGWNSYDAYGCSITEKEVLENLALFQEKLQPFGYDYFCLDACWYADGGQILNGKLKAAGKCRVMHIDEYGRFVPSPERFPNGLRVIADACHARGIKFGLHVMRGMPRLALERETKIFGTENLHASDIYDADNCSPWCKYVVGINPYARGAAEYYRSVVDYLADELTVDFIKLDDVTESMPDVEIFGKAVAESPRKILLSLSPGNFTWKGNWSTLGKYGNQVRITPDMWDDAASNELRLERWHEFENLASPECRLDLDMIPVGGLQVNVPEGTPEQFTMQHGVHRKSHLPQSAVRTMMTALALSGSPLFHGGALTETDSEDLFFLTHPEIRECCRRNIFARRIFFQRYLDIRRGDDRHGGYIGIFNRKNELVKASLLPEELGFRSFPAFCNIWNTPEWRQSAERLSFILPAEDCVFMKFNHQ